MKTQDIEVRLAERYVEALAEYKTWIKDVKQVDHTNYTDEQNAVLMAEYRANHPVMDQIDSAVKALVAIDKFSMKKFMKGFFRALMREQFPNAGIGARIVLGSAMYAAFGFHATYKGYKAVKNTVVENKKYIGVAGLVGLGYGMAKLAPKTIINVVGGTALFTARMILR